MPRISERRRQQQKDRILTAARLCFQANGIQNTSMADIIQTSGMSAGAVYTYFDSKEQLVRASIQQSQDLLSLVAASASKANGDTSIADVIGSLWAALSAIESDDGVDFKRLAAVGLEQARHDPVAHEMLQKRYTELIAQLGVSTSSESNGLSREQAASFIFVFLWGLNVTEGLFGATTKVTTDALEGLVTLAKKRDT
ncbi:TetR/AcrR family transcriptional regulator [Hoeflea alexandrii]|uniref:TetR family transcriptional regulator n=1 Tax=Hoeflea alexandrii TaxID=288436 RepID=A0ABT1CNV0_9HYPH|nr:TetR/AcrR family transcriptional regulator [Hoeflea alexandrii]MCO6407857.1 TetR family transcriptional regulator [Hoeflea alexandrii]MCY0153784.1 TetR/AcrR family transcriptional regulator [Hoeflea alexandrii]